MTRTLYTGGTFDILHYGHFNFLQKCRRIADKVVISLNTDEFIQSFKGSTPVMTYAERKKSLEHCHYVDEVIENKNGQDSKPTILSVSPSIIAIGDDWAQKNYYEQMNFTQEWLDENEFTLVYIPYLKGISTTEIKKRIIE